MIYLGIDPGANGAYAAINDEGDIVFAYKFTDWQEAFLAVESLIKLGNEVHAVIEAQHAMPKNGGCSAFSVGESYGGWQVLCIGLQIPFSFVAPHKWQKAVVDTLPTPKKPGPDEQYEEGDEEGEKAAKRAANRRRAANRGNLKAAIVEYVKRQYPRLPLSKKKDGDIADAVCIALYALRNKL